MTIHLDTSAFVDALTGARRSFDRLFAFVEEGHRTAISTVVLRTVSLRDTWAKIEKKAQAGGQ